jgi:hypothetical protein
MEVSAQLHAPAALPLRKEPLVLDRRLGGPRASLDAVVKRQILSSCWELNPDYLDHPTCSLVTILTELSWLFMDDFIASMDNVKHCNPIGLMVTRQKSQQTVSYNNMKFIYTLNTEKTINILSHLVM